MDINARHLIEIENSMALNNYQKFVKGGAEIKKSNTA